MTALQPVSTKTRFTRGQWLVLLAAFLGWMFDGLEQAIFPLVANPALSQLTGGKANVPQWFGYITACWLLGAACGGLVFGWLGDRIGRVRAMALSVLTYSLFTGVGYFAQAPWHLAGLRFVAALGMGGEWSLGVALVMECWPEDWRPMLAGCIGAAANVGYLLIAIPGMIWPVTVHSWRWVMLAVRCRRCSPSSSASSFPSRSDGRNRSSRARPGPCARSSAARCAAMRCWPSPSPRWR